MLKITRFLILICFFSFRVSAQDLRKDIELIAASYESSNYASIQAKVSVFNSIGGKKIYSSTSSFDKSDSATFRSLDDQELYTNKNYSIQVDHEDKIVFVHNNSKSKKVVSNDLIDMSQLLKLMDEDEKSKPPKITYLGLKNGLKNYSVLPNNSDIKEVQIFIDLKNKSINRLIYIYDERSEYGPQYVEITYSRFDLTTCDFDKLKIENFFVVVDSKKILQGKYKGYKLIEEI